MTKSKITFLAIGSRGDLNPACTLAKELMTRGNKVCIATHANFESFVKEKNIEYAPISGNYQTILNSEAGLNLMDGKGKFRLIEDELFYSQLLDAYEACKGSDLVVTFPLSLFGYHIAEKLNIPCIISSYVPITPTSKFPFLRFDLQKTNKLSAPLNRFSYSLIEFLSWNSDRKLINKFRQEILDLPPIPFLGTRYRKNAPKNFQPEEIPILHQFSPHVIPRPADWLSKNVFITGNWFIDEEKVYEPPQELVDFISQGQQPIYIGFGSMTIRDPKQTAEIISEAIRQTKQRAIFSPSWSKVEKYLEPKDQSIFVNSSYIPFNWLFPQMKFVIHHGGSGTTALALRAGIPQIIIPFFADQPAWGGTMVNLGVSPKLIPFKKLSTDQLISAILKITDSSLYSDKAIEVSKLIQQENGVKVAADLIEDKIIQFEESSHAS